MAFEATGILHHKGDVQINGKYESCEFVLLIADNPQYPQYVSFKIGNSVDAEGNAKKVNLMQKFQPGAKVKVNFNLRGRAWNSPQGETKYFNTLEVWSIFADNGDNSQPQGEHYQPQPQPQVAATQMSAAADIGGMEDSDDLPF